jgi:outer membrane protein assembly factor BamB
MPARRSIAPLVPLAVAVAVVLALGVTRAVRRVPSMGGAETATRETLGPEPRRAQDASAPALRGALPDAAVDVAPAAPRMLHGDPRRTHRAAARGPRAANVAWKVDVGGAVEAQITTSPDEQTLYVASLAGTVTALGRDGTKRFVVSLGDRVYSTPCVGPDGTIYVGSDAKAFVALSSQGAVRWRLELDADADTGPVLSPDGNVVFAAGAQIYSVRPGGDVAWRFRAKKKIFTAPAITPSGRIVFGAQDHNAYALEPNGTLAWAVDLGADVDGAPAVGDDGAIFVGTDAGEVVRLSDRGEIAWRAKLGGFVRGALSVARNGDVLAGVYGPVPRQARLDARSGALVGAFAIQGTGSEMFGVHGGALEDEEGTLYFGAQDDAVYAIDVEGRTRWRWVTGGDVDAPLTLLSDGSLVFGSDDGTVTMLRP